RRLACRLVARRGPPPGAAGGRQTGRGKGGGGGGPGAGGGPGPWGWGGPGGQRAPGARCPGGGGGGGGGGGAGGWAGLCCGRGGRRELLSKLWRGGGGMEEFRRTRPAAVLCELYAKLLAQVVRHWVVVAGAWARRDRSLTRAAAVVETLALSLAAAVRCAGR